MPSAAEHSTHDETSGPGHGRRLVLGLLTDPGFPTRLARRLVGSDNLRVRLSEEGDVDVTWSVETEAQYLEVDEHGTMPMLQIGRKALAERGWDAVILVTDLPRRAGTEPIVSDYSTTEYVGLLSVPALGAVSVRARAEEAIVHLVVEHLSPALTTAERGGADGTEETGRGHRDLGRTEGPVRHAESTVPGIDEHLVLTGYHGRLRLLSGMVRANRPWRLVPSLSPALAGAAAGAAFGIFYSNIWVLADALSVPRLALVSVLAVLAMIVWLIGNNGLWVRRRNRNNREQAVLDNVATLATISVAVLYIYALLCVVTVAAAVVVIPGDLMQSEVGHPVSFAHYLGLGWLAASMGIIAGALGSGLASEETVLQAAYSRREEERRRRQNEEAESS